MTGIIETLQAVGFVPELAIVSLAVGVGVGAFHGLAHEGVGEEDAFAEAGVNAAGITVVAAATTATYIVQALLVGGAIL
jgi:hypothetical protein